MNPTCWRKRRFRPALVRSWPSPTRTSSCWQPSRPLWHAGHLWVDDLVFNRAGNWRKTAKDIRSFRPRERLVVKLVAEGYSNKGISAILNSSVKTTETHRASAMGKLGVNSIAGLVRYAVRAKLVEK